MESVVKAVARGYFNLPWGQVHFRTAPSASGLTMLMLHQTPLSSRLYEPLLPLLAPACRPYALDTPGYGASSRPPEEWSAAQYAAAAWACADQLGAQKIVLFGRATGAVFALEAALTRPERVLGLVLHGLPVYSAAERAERMSRYPAEAPKEDGSHLLAIWNRIKSEYPWMDAAMATRRAQDYFAAGADFALSYRAVWRYDVTQRVRGQDAVPGSIPTLLIGGGADRIGFMHERASALLPGAEAVFLPEATDFVSEQQPQLIARPILEFLARHAP